MIVDMPREAKVGGGVWHEYILLLKKKNSPRRPPGPGHNTPTGSGPRQVVLRGQGGTLWRHGWLTLTVVTSSLICNQQQQQQFFQKYTS